MQSENKLTVFTKPWPELTLDELGKFVKDLGFDGIELPVRPNYQVTPNTIEQGLKEAVKVMKDNGLFISTVAGSIDEKTISACGENEIPIIRICQGIDMKVGYLQSIKNIQAEYDRLVPSLEKAGVAIGVQNHCGNMVASAIGTMHLIEKYNPDVVCAVYDPAHSAVDGETEEMGLDIVWSHLKVMNFKSASHRRTNSLNAVEAEWEVFWSTSQHSGYSWKKMVQLLKQRGFSGDICLPAEYSGLDGKGQMMGDDVIPFISYDLAYIKYLLAQDVQKSESPASVDWQSTAKKN